jgi:hypothetical protein
MLTPAVSLSPGDTEVPQPKPTAAPLLLPPLPSPPPETATQKARRLAEDGGGGVFAASLRRASESEVAASWRGDTSLTTSGARAGMLRGRSDGEEPAGARSKALAPLTPSGVPSHLICGQCLRIPI